MTKILSVLVTVFYIFISAVHAQEDVPSLNSGNAEQTNYYIKIPYQDINSKIVIEVILNGKPRKFVIDTGAPLTISENLFEEMKPSVLGNVSLKDANGIESLKDKINTGDEIIKIDDIDYSLYDSCDFYDGTIPFVDRTDSVTIVLKDVNTGKQKSIKLLLDNEIQ
jgi:hypothetical protein